MDECKLARLAPKPPSSAAPQGKQRRASSLPPPTHTPTCRNKLSLSGIRGSPGSGHRNCDLPAADIRPHAFRRAAARSGSCRSVVTMSSCPLSLYCSRVTGRYHATSAAGLAATSATLLLRRSVTKVRASEPSRKPLMVEGLGGWGVGEGVSRREGGGGACGEVGCVAAVMRGPDRPATDAPEHDATARRPPVLPHGRQLDVARVGQAAVLLQGALHHRAPRRACGCDGAGRCHCFG